jgi:adenylate cyclase
VAPDLPQRLAAILAADIAGYTRLMELDEAGTVAAWQRARAEVIDPTIAEHHGRIVKLTGDGFLAEFSTVESAVRAGLAMQRQFATMFAAMPAERRVAFRMGVNIGDIWVDTEDVYGAGVNVAARLESLARPGALCISDAVYAAVKHKVPANYEDIGPRRVKNVAAPVHVWRLSASGEASARRTRKPVELFGIASAVVVLAIIAMFLWRLDRPPATDALPAVAAVESATPSAVVEPDSIAVLPFYNIDGTDDMRIFSEGLSEDVINRLTVIPPLRVSSRGDSFELGPNVSSQEVRRRLRVAHYLEGSVRKTGERLRVVAQLIDSSNGFHVVSRTFDRPIGEFSQIQDEITKVIVANLRVALPSLADAPVYSTAETASFDAYLAYRRGMDIIHRPLTSASTAEALAAFRASLAVDPDYAAAYAGICLTYSAAYDVLRELEYIAQAERSCGAALERNPNLIVVHDALGELYLRTGRYADAERSFTRALAIHANDVPALTGLANAYSSQQRLVDAESRYRQAVGLQPGNWRAYDWLGKFFYANGRYREAAEAYREIVAIDDGNATGWGSLAAAWLLTGDLDAAAQASQRAMALDPSAQTIANAGMVHYYLGELSEARALLERAIATAPQYHVAWSNLGDVLAFSGDTEGARAAFTEAERLTRAQLEVNTQNADRVIDLAWITAMLGRLDEARGLIDRARALAPDDPYVDFYEALVRVRGGDTDAAIERLEAAVERGFSRALIRAEPHLRELRSQQRFAQLVAD